MSQGQSGDPEQKSKWDFLRRTVKQGMDTIGAAEIVSDLKLPKEAAQFIAQQSEKSRQEVARVVAKELRSFLESDLAFERLLAVMTGTRMSISLQIGFNRVPGGDVEPDISARVEKQRPDFIPTEGGTAATGSGTPRDDTSGSGI